MKNKFSILFLVLLLVLTGCSRSDVDEPTDVIVKAKEGDYEILSPYKPSPIRHLHASGQREYDTNELGRRLIDKSKEKFDVKKYYLSEGQLIDEDRYYELILFKSANNPNGLQTRYEELELDGVKLDVPSFISDIFELNFLRKDGDAKVAGISIGLLLDRIQFTDRTTGATHSLSDEALFDVGQTLGLQLSAYLRNIDGMSNVPIYISLFASANNMDRLPNNALPGHLIGEGYSQDRSMQFTKTKEEWIMLSDQKAVTEIPKIESAFSSLKRSVANAMGNEPIGIVGRAFVHDDSVDIVRLEINAPARTFSELYALGQVIASNLDNFASEGVVSKADISVFGTTRMTVTKVPGENVVLELFE